MQGYLHLIGVTSRAQRQLFRVPVSMCIFPPKNLVLLKGGV